MDFYSLGRLLKETRETQERTLDDAVNALKIRRRILESFEQGDFSVPEASPVQIRGFIRNYARFLRQDETLILQYYESALYNQRGGSRRRRKKASRRDQRHTLAAQAIPDTPRKLTDTNPTMPRVMLGEQREVERQRVAGVLNFLLVFAVGVAAVAVIFFVVLELLTQADSNLIPQSPDILLQLPSTPTRTVAPTLTPRPQATELPIIVQSYSGTGVLVTIRTEQRSWIRVTVDGTEQLARLILPGESHEFSGLEQIIVEASNAQALNIYYNGQEQGTFGGRGQAAEITFTVNDVDIQTGPGPQPPIPQTATPSLTPDNLAATLIVARTPTATDGPSPTPTLTYTPSNTPTITLTPSATFTPSETPTVTPTPTITPTASNTLPPSATPTVTPTSSQTLAPSITPTPSNTAILPPRETPNVTPTPTKNG